MIRALLLVLVFLNVGCESARSQREREYAEQNRRYELYRIEQLERQAMQDPEEACAGRKDKADCLRGFEIRLKQLNSQVDRIKQKHQYEDQAKAQRQAAEDEYLRSMSENLSSRKSWGHYLQEREDKKTRCKSRRTWDGEVETVCE